MCTCVHISVTKLWLWDICLAHCGICEMGLWPNDWQLDSRRLVYKIAVHMGFPAAVKKIWKIFTCTSEQAMYEYAYFLLNPHRPPVVCLVNSLRSSEAYMPVILVINSSNNGLSPVRCQSIIWTNAESLLIGPLENTSEKFWLKFQHFYSRKYVWECRLESGDHFVSASMCLSAMNISYNQVTILECFIQKAIVFLIKHVDMELNNN